MMSGLFLLCEEPYSAVRTCLYFDLQVLLNGRCRGRKRQNCGRDVMTLDTTKNPIGSWRRGLV